MLTTYTIYVCLKGFTLIKRMLEADWHKEKGIQKAVKTWTAMNIEERMQADLDTLKDVRISKEDKPVEIKTEEPSRWLGNPTPEEESSAMNERVYREGLKHRLPETKVEEVSKE